MPPHTLVNMDMDQDYRYRRWANYFLISRELLQVVFFFLFCFVCLFLFLLICVLFTYQLTKIVMAGTKYILRNVRSMRSDLTVTHTFM